MHKLYLCGKGKHLWPHLGFPSLFVLLFKCYLGGWGSQRQLSFFCSLTLLLKYAPVCLKLVVTCLLSIKASVISLLPILVLHSRYLYPVWFLKTLLKSISQLSLPFSATYVWDLTSEGQNFIHMLFSLMFLNIRVLKLRTFGVNQNSQFHLSLFSLELFFIAMNKVLMLLAKSNCSKSVSCQIGFSDDYVDILKFMMCQMKRCIYLFQITEHTTFKQKMNRNT